MNISVIRYVLGTVIKIEAVLFVLPIIMSAIYGEKEGLAYLAAMGICGIFGIIMTIRKPKNFVFYLKEGCVATSLSWILLAFFGCLPLIFTGEIPSVIDAFFEISSGFTTTGASVLNDVESLSHASLLWRSITNWIGGMGVLVFLLAIIPLTGGSNMNLMKAESPGPSVEKIVPKVRYTARILYIIYVVMTFLQFILLVIGKMPVFDAICTSLSTAGTGGFGIKNDSMAGFSPYIQWVVAIFMFAFAVNFNAYYFIILRRFKSVFKMEEVRSFIIIVLVSVGVITVATYERNVNVLDTLRHAVFQVGTVVSTTGFSTVDYNNWPEIAKVVIVFLMFMGGCAGSTAGGTKVSRIVVLVKTVFKEINSYLHPKSVKKIKVDGKPVEHEVIRSINVYFAVYFMIFAASVILISFEGKGLVTNFTAVLATFNNIGPGLDGVGPANNFGHFSDFAKIVLSFDMLIGRLELFPMLVLFYPPIWKEAITAKIRQVKKKRLKNESK